MLKFFRLKNTIFFTFHKFKKFCFLYLPMDNPYWDMIYWDELSEAYHYLQNASAHIYDYTATAQTISFDISGFLGIKMCSLNVSFGALMVFGGHPIPSTAGLGCSASVHSKMVLIHQLRAISWKDMCLRMIKSVCNVLRCPQGWKG